jgi:hypothetical protein
LGEVLGTQDFVAKCFAQKALKITRRPTLNTLFSHNDFNSIDSALRKSMNGSDSPSMFVCGFCDFLLDYDSNSAAV